MGRSMPNRTELGLHVSDLQLWDKQKQNTFLLFFNYFKTETRKNTEKNCTYVSLEYEFFCKVMRVQLRSSIDGAASSAISTSAEFYLLSRESYYQKVIIYCFMIALCS